MDQDYTVKVGTYSEKKIEACKAFKVKNFQFYDFITNRVLFAFEAISSSFSMLDYSSTSKN